MASPSEEGRGQLRYHPGFCSEICSEALPHALPKGQVMSTAALSLLELQTCVLSSAEQSSGLSVWAVL